MKFQVKKIIFLTLAAAITFTGSIFTWGVDSKVNGSINSMNDMNNVNSKTSTNNTSNISNTSSTSNVNNMANASNTSNMSNLNNAGKSSDYIAFYVENPVYHVNGEEKQIDVNNKKVSPYLKKGNVFIPVRFIVEALGGSIEWDAAQNISVIRDNNGNVFSLAANSDVINIDKSAVKLGKSTVKMGDKSELRNGRLYAPAAAVAEAFGKSVFYERGLIIITDSKYKPDSVKDKALIDSLIEKFTGIISVGTKEELTELLGYDPEDDSYVVYDEIAPELAEEAPVATQAQASAPVPAAPQTNGAVAEAESGGGAADFSETNIQVQGVDEADIIKTDGNYIYYVRNQVIEIVKANADGSFEHMSSFSLPEENSMNFNEIFSDGGRIIAIGSYYYDGANTKAVVINTEDKKAPKLERSVEVKGNYVTSRKIGSSVYLVANKYLSPWYGNYTHIMPEYYDTAVSDDMIEIGYDRLRCFPVIFGNSITSLVGFNIDKPNEKAFIETFFGAGDNVYMSENAMYIAAASHGANGSETIIHKFAADDGKIVFVKSGKAPGTILNQFSMDEYQSHFRIATTVYEYNPTYKEYNGLYIFDNTMEIVGRIDDIAPGEHIYSARFMGARGYMVTFKTVDPLFAIDLSDPKKPVVLGALKIPGYSNYLHPYDENHLIGFGKDTVVDSYNNAYYTSMKISLFDVTDMANPIEMFVETIGARGTDSLLLSNHKALLFSKEKGLLAFPVTVYESNEKAVDGKMPSYGTFAFSGAYVYDIDLKEGFKLRGKISHMSSQDMLKSSDWSGNPDLYIQRLLTIRDTLYAASNGKLSSHNMSTLNPIDEFDFKDK